MKYRIQQKASVWIEVSVEAENLIEAVQLAEQEIEEGHFKEDPASFTLEDEYWWEDENEESGTL
jgi:hypothetical protein